MKTTLKDKLSKILFHGTLMDRAESIRETGIDFTKLGDKADFAKGFYLTDSYALAENTAILRYNQESMVKDNPAIPVVMKFKLNKCNLEELTIKEFYGASDEWRRFICTNRWYDKILKRYPDYDHNIDRKYDIVIGLTADGKMRNVNTILKRNNYILTEDFLKNINPLMNSYFKYVNGKRIVKRTKSYQISIHNEEFLRSCIRYKGYDIIRLEKEDEHYG